jgi:hypothetical protein
VDGRDKRGHDGNGDHLIPIGVILLPLFVEVILTFGLLFATAFARTRDLRTKQIHPRDIALGQVGWPVKTQQLGNAYNNQFQLPVLFYVLTILAIITKDADTLFVVMAWIFVLARIAHAYVHITGNNVFRRGPIFGIGGITLMLMWLIFVVRVVFGL